MGRATDRMLTSLARRTGGVRRVRRPGTATTPAFDLAYARTGPGSPAPVVLIPGGPGLASVLPYRGIRREAARRGLDVIMVEHRGVGLSRTDLDGRDLPTTAMRVVDVLDDVAAVLDHEGIETAHLVGSSYGSYLASAFGARHPARVRGMLLDSALQSADDIDLERAELRRLFWDSDRIEARAVRRLVDAGIDETALLGNVRAAYELGGDPLVRPLLRRRLTGRRDLVWSALSAYAGRGETIAHVAGVYEFDLVGTIAFRELHYGAPPDGLPFDPARIYRSIADRYPPFAGEAYDLAARAAGFTWPTVLLAGRRDLRTPVAIARRVAATAPGAVYVEIENGHSALESHPRALLHAAGRLVAGQAHLLPNEVDTIDRMPPLGLTARLPGVLRTLGRAQRALPGF